MFEPYQIAASPVDVLGYWAAKQPDKTAYVFLAERGGEEASLTFF